MLKRYLAPRFYVPIINHVCALLKNLLKLKTALNLFGAQVTNSMDTRLSNGLPPLVTHLKV